MTRSRLYQGRALDPSALQVWFGGAVFALAVWAVLFVVGVC